MKMRGDLRYIGASAPYFSAPIIAFLTVVIVFTGFLWPTESKAQTPSPLAEWQYSGGVLLDHYSEPSPEWQMQAGGGISLSPSFDGSPRYRAQLEPLLEIRYRELAFLSLGEGLGINLVSDKNYRAGIALSYDLGRRDGDDRRLRGVGNIAAAPEFKIFAEYLVFSVVLRADIRRAFAGQGGLIGDLGAYFPIVGAARYSVLVGPSLTLANREHEKRFYGIDQQQAARSGYPTFDAHGGASHASIGVNALWNLDAHWFVEGVAALSRTLGHAARSPLIQTPAQYAANVYFGYDF
jgi:outer membrane scaffolding protein for murein synthesis (MipA/OmpV family)